MGRVEAVAERAERELVSWRLEVGRAGGQSGDLGGEGGYGCEYILWTRTCWVSGPR